MEFKSHSMAAGFGHTAAVTSEGNLYVWGDNSNKILREHTKSQKQPLLDLPTHIPLMYNVPRVQNKVVDNE